MTHYEAATVGVHDPCERFVERIKAIRTGGAGSAKRPHKLLLLLALVRLYKRDPTRLTHVPLDDALSEAFSEAIRELLPGTAPNTILIEYPFFHLTTDGFWFLELLPGKEDLFKKYRDAPNMRLTHRRLLETVEAGYLNDSFDTCLRDPSGNARIEDLLKRELTKIASLQENVITEAQKSNSLFAHEKAALDAISDRVASHQLGEVLTNLEIHDAQSNRYFEVDLVLVSPYGIFVTELKHWSGRIEIRPNSWLQNSSFYKTDPHKVNNFKAKLLKGLYERRFPSFAPIYFESVVVLTNPDVSAKGQSVTTTTTHNPTFDSIDRFVRYLKHQHEISGSILSQTQCHGFAEYVRV